MFVVNRDRTKRCRDSELLDWMTKWTTGSDANQAVDDQLVHKVLFKENHVRPKLANLAQKTWAQSYLPVLKWKPPS